ncbi:hypothetical protein N7468_001941 [Penicillium chermesinum]|uniref:Bromo domain-containing protein n=1 Tax=Penicillium chermesinum TaxID=63820 RepID=A0A9W9PJQ1_9EURO|nr:uncharacterized protein N7468_001941 [Penicillium chermesinum]KAJ5246958.1 hypothetical protein N7468_001941 [Penicillium chermesinum]
MATKRRVAAAATPETKLRSQKRRKVSEENIVDPAESIGASSEPVDEDELDQSTAEQDKGDESEGFQGDSLQAAQDKILSELTRLKDSDGEDVSYPFTGKPDRNAYRDYYEIIQHPVSLRSIQKKVRGTDTRKKGTKMTAFPTWHAFEEEVSYIWRNAREYNEDGSEISKLAGVLEGYFKQRVIEAKKLVPDHIQQNHEVPEATPPSGVAVDNESLKKQQELVRKGSASQEADAHHTPPRTRSLRRHQGSPRSSVATTPSASELSHGLGGGVKGETPVIASQSADIRYSHGPHAGSVDSTSGHVSYEASSAALIRNVQILTHPSLALAEDFCLDIPPSSTLIQQTITIPLPPSHHFITVRPTVVDGTTQRQIKLVAAVGMQRLHPVEDTSALAYDIQLHPGTTKLDLEVIAGPARGTPKSGPPGSEVEYERVTIFFSLLRCGLFRKVDDKQESEGRF